METLAFLKKYFIYLFLERRERREKEGERNINVQLIASHVPPTGDLAATQACALTGNRTGNPMVHRLGLNLLSHTSWGKTLASLFLITLTYLQMS